MKTKLITIPFSHYCEKARWALDRCAIPYVEDGHLPLFHYLPTKLAGARRTVPVLITDGVRLADSTEIVAWADAQRPSGLIPDSRAPAARADALALEDDFDRHLGPATRRWAYFYLLPRTDLDAFLTRGVPRWEAMSLKLVRPLAVRMLKQGLRIDAEGVERSRVKIEETFATVAARLADGRRYLTGDRFTVADLTFAALASPVLLPREHPIGLPHAAELPEVAQTQVAAWRASPAGRFAQRLYTEHRAP